MSNNNETPSNPASKIDPYKFLELEQNPDGTITRLSQTPSTPASSCDQLNSPIITKDYPLNPINNTFLRLFLPHQIAFSDPSRKLPIIVYFHGGGFVFHHADSTMFHNFCSQVATYTSALVVSVDYRLAPEHRLPTAYIDAMDTLRWIIRASSSCNKEQVHYVEWLTKYGDYSKCFLMGSSAGGNIAYHVGLMTLKLGNNDMGPLKINGLILHQPYFGGLQRSGSELKMVDDPYVPLSANDLFWDLSLPIGADRDHEYCNLKLGDGPDLLDKAKELAWRVLVTGCSGDPLMDRGLELVKLLEEKGVVVKGYFTESDYHAVEIFDSVKCNLFLTIVTNFMHT